MRGLRGGSVTIERLSGQDAFGNGPTSVMNRLRREFLFVEYPGPREDRAFHRQAAEER